ncbi:MAG: hypothetical protein KY468_14595, partial [Armatimonadetes bacterium]|nr:hypothetical protein [Armatimonadota bacterium]
SPEGELYMDILQNLFGLPEDLVGKVLPPPPAAPPDAPRSEPGSHETVGDGPSPHDETEPEVSR